MGFEAGFAENSAYLCKEMIPRREQKNNLQTKIRPATNYEKNFKFSTKCFLAHLIGCNQTMLENLQNVIWRG